VRPPEDPCGARQQPGPTVQHAQQIRTVEPLHDEARAAVDGLGAEQRGDRHADAVGRLERDPLAGQPSGMPRILEQAQHAIVTPRQHLGLPSLAQLAPTFS
jgi:hypothetical protein